MKRESNVLSSRFPMSFNFRSGDRTLIVRSLTTAGLGAVGKILGLINQIFSVALISKALGAEGLQEMLLAIAFVSWFSLALSGMHTALPALLIRTRADPKDFASIAKVAFFIALIGACGALGLTLLILNVGSINTLTKAPIATAAICNAAAIVLSLSEKIFQATDRISQFNCLNIAGTLASLTATALLTYTHGTAAQFIVAYYLGILFPFLVATLVVIPRLNLAVRPSLKEIRGRASELVRIGFFGFGYEIAAYCKLQAPLALLSALGLSIAIAPVGLGFRLISLLGSGLSIIIPILFLRIGAAIEMGDNDARRQWTRFGIAFAVVLGVATAGLILIFGQSIYQKWTSGAVILNQSDQVAIAIFAAICIAQFLLFPLAAPDPTVAGSLRWLFWLEGPAVLAAGTVGALAVPAPYGGAGMLVGATIVMGVSLAYMFFFLGRSLSSQRNGER
jgi:hypothetical protein